MLGRMGFPSTEGIYGFGFDDSSPPNRDRSEPVVSFACVFRASCSDLDASTFRM
jgi:hypothetical protein